MKKDIVAVAVKNVDRDDSPRGAFKLYKGVGAERIEGITYKCPCGCGRVGYLGFKGRDKKFGTHTWNRDKNKPTIKETITEMLGGKVHWEGELTDGVWLSYK